VNIRLDPTDLLRDPIYRRLWISILISQFGGQITLLALPLTAAVLLHASPTQMGYLTAAEVIPFAIFSLPTGVWLDRVHKLPVYVTGELAIAIAVTTVPIAWWLHWLSMPWLYLVGFMIGCVNTAAGSAAQIVLTQIVPRSRLVEAHAKNALAQSGAEVAGPGAAGALIKITGAPFTARGRLAAPDLGVDPARRAPEGNSQCPQSAVLARDAHGLAVRAQPFAAGRDGGLRRHLADVQPGGGGRADTVCNPAAGPRRALGRFLLCGARLRYGGRQRRRP
jgi:MFS family permease